LIGSSAILLRGAEDHETRERFACGDRRYFALALLKVVGFGMGGGIPGHGGTIEIVAFFLSGLLNGFDTAIEEEIEFGVNGVGSECDEESNMRALAGWNVPVSDEVLLGGHITASGADGSGGRFAIHAEKCFARIAQVESAGTERGVETLLGRRWSTLFFFCGLRLGGVLRSGWRCSAAGRHESQHAGGNQNQSDEEAALFLHLPSLYHDAGAVRGSRAAEWARDYVRGELDARHFTKCWMLGCDTEQRFALIGIRAVGGIRVGVVFGVVGRRRV